MVVARRLQAASPRWFFDPLEARTGRSECCPDALRAASAGKRDF